MLHQVLRQARAVALPATAHRAVATVHTLVAKIEEYTIARCRQKREVAQSTQRLVACRTRTASTGGQKLDQAPAAKAVATVGDYRDKQPVGAEGAPHVVPGAAVFDVGELGQAEREREREKG